ncbi:MAG: SAM-dependent methyltransferase [Candidatus Daviesbacteria bacterium]|nr:SAM-dependent methyltransferase [Candidatus Daviesbacteria bacterium]
MTKPLNSSFRDPSGYVFIKGESVFRRINKSYLENYGSLIKSGLYDKLISLGYLVKHRETERTDTYITIQPEKIPFISYPYEWCFSMLKNAALLTLDIQKIAMEYNMSLKDASAFNIQFTEGKPILIDTLSFEKYEAGKPWIAYKQFAEHFLAPLTLMSMTDARLNRLSSLFIDGVPLDLTSKLLPFSSKLRPSILFHIHAHAKGQKNLSEKKLSSKQIQSFSKQAFLGLLDNLEGVIRGLSWKPKGTEWADYTDTGFHNYEDTALQQKSQIIRKIIKRTKPKTVWDLGANTGRFSRIAAEDGAFVLSFDFDYGALEKNYLEVVSKKEKNILPLFLDLTNPTPSIGWANEERLSLFRRGPTDLVLALALIHHLSISKNIPLNFVALLFSQISKNLIIEFVPKEDSQVQRLLQNRKDIFVDYNRKGFENAFNEFFNIKEAISLSQSKRIIYLMEKK